MQSNLEFKRHFICSTAKMTATIIKKNKEGILLDFGIISTDKYYISCDLRRIHKL